MFGFLKKTLKGFVDQFKKDDSEEIEKQNETEPTKISEEQNTIIEKPELLKEQELAFDVPEENIIEEEDKIITEDILEESKKTPITDVYSNDITKLDEVIEDEPQHSIEEQNEFEELEPKTVISKPETKSPIVEEKVEVETKRETEKISESIPESKSEVFVEDPKKKGFFAKLADSITKRTISEQEFDRMFEELELSLLENNTAYDVVEKIKISLRDEITSEKITRNKPHEIIRQGLTNALNELFIPHEPFMKKVRSKKPYIIMFLGVNGSGKTTSIAKIAYQLKKNNITPVLAAGDTFRAAAIQQLEEHANKIEVRIIKHDYGADPAAVAFDAIKHAESGKADVVLIDTAGRLHSNDNLLKELEKIKRIAKPDLTLFVGEAIAGNDVIEQASVFNEKIGIDGIILTKADVDEKGGAALSVSYVTQAPIYFIGLGQGYDDLTEFTPELIMNALGLDDNKK